MADLRTQEVNYSADGVSMKGYMAWDGSIEGKRPGVLVVHEFWGHNDYARKRADMLAELGYTAMSLDLYGDGAVSDHPEEASKLMMAIIEDLPTGRKRFNAALAELKAHETVNQEKTGAVGYCFGGGMVLHMARYGADVNVVASFHGSLPLALAAEGEGAEVSARVVAYNGEDDPLISSEDITAFKSEMENAGAQYQFINYPGTLHSFTNSAATERGEKYGIPLKYNALADHSSWDHMRLLLESVFRG
jgi:dienelactone hydrolase